jgi:hypothetical protein
MCTHKCAISLFHQQNRIILRIIKKELLSYIGHKTPVQPTRKRHGARDQIPSVSESWRAQGSTTKMSVCFIDYTKDFDSVQHLKMWNSIRSVGITKHSTVLI